MNREEMPRWIFGSISKHFHDLSVVLGVPMFVEGQKRDTRSLKKFFELRMDGPDFLDYGSVVNIDYQINILIQVSLGGQDAHAIHKLAGQVAKVFTRRMVIYQIPESESIEEGWVYGDLVGVGCAVLKNDHKNRDVRIFHFGQVNPEILIQRASVTGSYRLTLSEQEEEGEA